MQLDADGGFETESRLTDERSQAARPQDRRILSVKNVFFAVSALLYVRRMQRR